MQNAKILRTMELHLHSNHKSWYPQQLDKLCGCKVGIKENVVRFEYLAELTFPFSSPRVQKSMLHGIASSRKDSTAKELVKL